MNGHNLRGGLGLAVISLSTPPAHAQAAQRYDIAAQDLAGALQRFASVSGREVVAASPIVATKRSAPLRGVFTAEGAMHVLLSRAGLRADIVDGAFVIRPIDDIDGDRAIGQPPAADIVVTGSRIRGAPVAATVITITQNDMRDAGRGDIGAVVRDLPQSFGGGQNPGVGANVPSASGINVGSASTINLRGLGSDATLTLLNGHRLAYNGSRQGIDVSSLPIAIVERIEIVPDGASALYGSDAVAGVANIILKRDYDTVQVRAALGGATDGGAFEQRYSTLAGRRWTSGGVVAAYEFARNSDISSTQRPYAASRPGVTIYPELRRHAVAIAGHQTLTDGVEFAVDALFNTRSSSAGFPLNAAGDLSISRTEQISSSRSLAVAPSLSWQTPSSWRLILSGVYGDERVRLTSNSFTGAALSSTAFVCYCNKGASAELAADGRLFALPGGFAKLATGLGYRYNLLDAFRAVGNVNNVRRTQDSYYAYGELNLPLVGPAADIPAVSRLNASAAVRYERYPGTDGVAVPKFGLIYTPVSGVDFTGSWGRSFRAPTLFQQYQVASALLYPAASLGGTGLPATATALFVQGGNPDLDAERARTWTLGVGLQPPGMPGFRTQLSYFSTRYTDRIVTPISFLAQALSNSINAGQVTRQPGAELVNATIAGAAQFFNVSGRALNPAAVAAIVDNRNVNAGSQRIEGLDFLVSYRTAIGAGQIGTMVNVSYLTSDQQLVPGAAIVERAGTLFNPPHWRGRGTLTWSSDPVTLFVGASHVGGVQDVRSTPAVRIGSVTTIDLTGRYAPTALGGVLQGFELGLKLLNVFNTKPDRIATTLPSDSAFDSTNYSPIGRFIGVEVSKTW